MTITTYLIQWTCLACGETHCRETRPNVRTEVYNVVTKRREVSEAYGRPMKALELTPESITTILSVPIDLTCTYPDAVVLA